MKLPGSIHVSEVSLAQSPDAAVWEYANIDGYTILTADADFFELTTTLGPPPKVLWLVSEAGSAMGIRQLI